MLRRAGILLLIVGTGVAAALSAPSAATFPNDDQAIVHVLNRIGFGPRSGDVAKVREIGLQQYIDDQLHPDRVPDPGMESRLAGLKTIGLSSREIAEQFARPLLEMRRDRRQQQTAGNGNPAANPIPPAARGLQQQANAVLVELGEQKMLRAVYSERQLQEVLTDFWFNHFNVDARKGQVRFLLTEYERETIRPHVLGRFRDLLEADAKSPAMLFYLDNWLSAGPNGPQNRQRKGLNENYGRELMELHTVGVDGGYTQKDVTEVARAFTGWTIDNPRMGGGFRFEPRIHDQGEKIVLGHRIKAGGGMSDGEQVLDILAGHSSTAHFISFQLARRFVSDTPPAALVDRVAARFREMDGDLREVMRAILTSPEFLSGDARAAKVKTPLEFIVSAIRATGADVSNAVPLVRAMQQLGMPLYQCQPPTGYKDTADAWTNTGALVGRMNFALTLASNKLPGTFVATASPQTTALALGSPEFQKR